MGNIIDLTFKIETGMPTCGTPWHQAAEISPLGLIDEVGRNTSKIVLGSHTGTHMDAPCHFIEGGDSIENVELSLVCGPVTIIDFSKIRKKNITVNDFSHVALSKRILLRFDWFKKWKTAEYYKDFPYLELDSAKYLLNQGVRVIAMDTPSPDPGNAIKMKDDSPVHKFLLKNGVVIMEYLTNTDLLLKNRKYEIIALPLKISGGDGCPSRIIAREI